MDLRLSEDQRLIAESAADFLADAAAMPATRAAADGAAGIDAKLWQGIAELGWCGLNLPEAHGGLGLGPIELALLQEQLGRRLACVPFMDSALAAALLCDASAGASGAGPADASGAGTAAAHWLPRLATGQSIATVANDASAARAWRDGAGWRLQGRWPALSSATQADLLLLPARSDDGDELLLALPRTTAGLQLRELNTIDRTRRCAEVTVAEPLALDAAACIARGAPLRDALARQRALAALALAAEQVGVAQQCLDQSVAYTQERFQFGRAVASFQAVKHRCAQMMVLLESARSAVYGSAARLAEAPAAAERDTFTALALVEAHEAALYCAQEAIQLHGGVGFTWEYDPHLYFKRAQANSQRLGPASAWLEQVAVQLLDEAP